MIVPMKRAYLFFLKSEESSALKKLRSLGTFHLEIAPAAGGNIEVELEQIRAAKKVEARLIQIEKPSRGVEASLQHEVVPHRLAEVLALVEQEQKLRELFALGQRDLNFLLPWGDFDPGDLAKFSESGAQLELLLLSQQELDRLRELPVNDYGHWVVGQQDESYFCVAMLILPGRARPEFLPKAVLLPEMGLEQLQKLQQTRQVELTRLQERMRSYLYLQASLHDYIATLEQLVEFESVREGLTAVENKLVYASGFLPVDSVEILADSARRYGWGFMVRDPKEDELVPTKLQQNWIARLINPITSFLEVTPGYREVDTTGVFFTFFTIFVAMIVGDAAYGLAILVGAIVLGFATRSAGVFVQMLLVLGLATVIWGALSGAWFGSYVLASSAPLKQLSIWQLSSFPEQLFGKSAVEQQRFVMMLCFTLAAIHLTIARLWNFFRSLPHLKALAQLGITALVLSLYQLVLFMVDIIPSFQPFFLYLLIAGFTIMVVFGQQQRGENFFVGLKKGLIGLFTSFLDTVGVFADIMSYVRLFAVGIASSSIAASFNGMAGGIAAKGGVLVVLGIIVLVLGHVINFALACLSVIVHAVRLNMLEFSNHMGLEWSGIPYRPFKERRINL